MSNFPVEDAIKPECDALRADILAIENRSRALKDAIMRAAGQHPGGPGEMIANSIIAVRHLEDARMRIGKVLQYARDGVSCFDHSKETP